MSSTSPPILVTGAGRGVGRTVATLLRQHDQPVRAMLHRDDEKAVELKAIGCEIVIGDLTEPADVLRALKGCKRVYFGLSVSSVYLEATVCFAAAARSYGELELLVNISQMTVSQMDLHHLTSSHQQRQHYFGEQVLNWSSLPVVHIRSTVFMDHRFFTQWAAASIKKDNSIHLPFGSGRTSPISVKDLAAVIATILEQNPTLHAGKIYELTGPRSQNMNEMVQEYSCALHKTISYIDEPYDEWCEQIRDWHLPDYVIQHFHTMAKLHKDNRYDRLTTDVEKIIGRPPMSVEEYVRENLHLFEDRKGSST